MKIGILGAGLMSEALGSRWAQLGYQVFIGARNVDRAAQTANKGGDQIGFGSLRDAVAFSDIALLAIRYQGVLSTLLSAGASEGAFIGKTIIDCNNPVETDAFTIATGPDRSLAELIAATAHGSSVVKAFHLCQAHVWKIAPPAFDGRRLTVPICGNEHHTKQNVSAMIEEMGCLPVDLGPLQQARNLEPMAAVIIKLLFEGADPSTNFNLVDNARKATATG